MNNNNPSSWQSSLQAIVLFVVSTRTVAAFVRYRYVSRPFTADLQRSSSHKDSSSFVDQLPRSSVSDLRKEYSCKGISDADMNGITDPIQFFASWFEEACKASALEPNAMCLSTCHDNKPSARIVLMKDFNELGFVWYTNYNSRKSCELLNNPFAASTFWWGELERSVRIEGTVERVSCEEADRYFSSRPRGSQLGAWSSLQSSEVASRAELEQQQRAVELRFSDPLLPVPRPPHWGGFRLVPDRIEFWKGRESRMHDRILFERANAGDGSTGWRKKRLQP